MSYQYFISQYGRQLLLERLFLEAVAESGHVYRVDKEEVLGRKERNKAAEWSSNGRTICRIENEEEGIGEKKRGKTTKGYIESEERKRLLELV